MKTIIFDIDGTLTDMWPIERSVLLALLGKNKAIEVNNLFGSGIKETYKIYSLVSRTKIGKQRYTELYNKTFSLLLKCNRLPRPAKYPVVNWLTRNRAKYNFVYATGGQRNESRYVLESLGITKYFDLKNSLDKTNCKFSKSTGILFRKIAKIFPQCLVITDGESDCRGAARVGIPCIKMVNIRC